MYSAKFESSDGKIFGFGYEYGVVFDIDPLSELDVDIGSNQGFGQIGETVQTQSLSGVNRTIEGRILDGSLKDAMLSIFSPFSSGRLVFQGKWFCDCVVKKAPAIRVSGIDVTFSLMLFCPSPYWKSVSKSYYSMGVIVPAFSYPCTLTTHTFGTKNDNAFVNVLNKGERTSDFTISFTASLPVETYGLVDVITGSFIKIHDELQVGERTVIRRDNGMLRVQKETPEGGVDIFSDLDEDSTLFYLEKGDNVLAMTADTGLSYLSCEISFFAARSGVYDGM